MQINLLYVKNLQVISNKFKIISYVNVEIENLYKHKIESELRTEHTLGKDRTTA